MDNSINKDLNSWKLYENNQTINAHGMMEFKIPLSDAAIKGSEANINEVDQVLSTYQLRFNQTNFEADAYQMCVNNTLMDCSDYLLKESQVISQLKKYFLAGDASSSNAKESYAEIKKIDKIVKDGTEDEKKTLYHDFYHKQIPMLMGKIELEVLSEEKLLVKDYADYLDQVFDSRLARLENQFVIDSKNKTVIEAYIATL